MKGSSSSVLIDSEMDFSRAKIHLSHSPALVAWRVRETGWACSREEVMISSVVRLIYGV